MLTTITLAPNGCVPAELHWLCGLYFALVSTTFRIANSADPVRHRTLNVLPGQRFLSRTGNIQLLRNATIITLNRLFTTTRSAKAQEKTRLTTPNKIGVACGGFQSVILWPAREISNYTGVLVEMWDYKDYGRGKREWLKEFDEAERKKIGDLYRKAYGWVMRTGHPDNIQMPTSTYELLVRTANFFGSL